MKYLIDGYNLMHAGGWAVGPTSPISWERARTKMLDWLAMRHGKNAADACIVFDAQHSVGTKSDLVHHGLRVIYAREGTADDVIEAILDRTQSAARLTVVSNDQRIQKAAERRGAVSWSCGEYLDSLIDPVEHRPPTPKAADEPDEKMQQPSDAEMEEWMRVFSERKPPKPK